MATVYTCDNFLTHASGLDPSAASVRECSAEGYLSFEAAPANATHMTYTAEPSGSPHGGLMLHFAAASPSSVISFNDAYDDGGYTDVPPSIGYFTRFRFRDTLASLPQLRFRVSLNPSVNISDVDYFQEFTWLDGSAGYYPPPLIKIVDEFQTPLTVNHRFPPIGTGILGMPGEHEVHFHIRGAGGATDTYVCEWWMKSQAIGTSSTRRWKCLWRSTLYLPNPLTPGFDIYNTTGTVQEILFQEFVVGLCAGADDPYDPAYESPDKLIVRGVPKTGAATALSTAGAACVEISGCGITPTGIPFACYADAGGMEADWGTVVKSAVGDEYGNTWSTGTIVGVPTNTASSALKITYSGTGGYITIATDGSGVRTLTLEDAAHPGGLPVITLPPTGNDVTPWQSLSELMAIINSSTYPGWAVVATSAAIEVYSTPSYCLADKSRTTVGTTPVSLSKTALPGIKLKCSVSGATVVVVSLEGGVDGYPARVLRLHDSTHGDYDDITLPRLDQTPGSLTLQALVDKINHLTGGDPDYPGWTATLDPGALGTVPSMFLLDRTSASVNNTTGTVLYRSMPPWNAALAYDGNSTVVLMYSRWETLTRNPTYMKVGTISGSSITWGLEQHVTAVPSGDAHANAIFSAGYKNGTWYFGIYYDDDGVLTSTAAVPTAADFTYTANLWSADEHHILILNDGTALAVARTNTYAQLAYASSITASFTGSGHLITCDGDTYNGEQVHPFLPSGGAPLICWQDDAGYIYFLTSDQTTSRLCLKLWRTEDTIATAADVLTSRIVLDPRSPLIPEQSYRTAIYGPRYPRMYARGSKLMMIYNGPWCLNAYFDNNFSVAAGASGGGSGGGGSIVSGGGTGIS